MSNEYEQPVEPMSRTEDLLRTGTEEPVIAMSEIEKILRGEHIDRPHSRVADLLLQYNPSDILIEKRIEENGTYYATADAADGYYKVVVDTPVIPPTVLEHLVETISTNGTHIYTPGTGVDGFSDASITVNVPANVTSRGLQVNGTFSSAVDDKDGYSSVTVNVQEAPVKTTSLSVTENGTYVPGPASEVSLTIPTIPDEVETDVSAGAIITNFDNLRIEFTNKTTSATGHVDIYPSAIAVQQIPMSFKNRTLIMGPDGDHYITIVNGYDSIVVLQKGYTITAMRLTSESGYFSSVEVNVQGSGGSGDYIMGAPMREYVDTSMQVTNGSVLDVVWNSGVNISCQFFGYDDISSYKKLIVTGTTGTSYYNTRGAHDLRKLYIGTGSAPLGTGYFIPTSFSWNETPFIFYTDNSNFKAEIELGHEHDYIYCSANGWNISNLTFTLVNDEYEEYKYHWSNDGKICVREEIGSTKWIFCGVTKTADDMDVPEELEEYLPQYTMPGQYINAKAYATPSATWDYDYIGFVYPGTENVKIRTWHNSGLTAGTFYGVLDISLPTVNQDNDYTDPYDVKAGSKGFSIETAFDGKLVLARDFRTGTYHLYAVGLAIDTNFISFDSIDNPVIKQWCNENLNISGGSTAKAFSDPNGQTALGHFGFYTNSFRLWDDNYAYNISGTAYSHLIVGKNMGGNQPYNQYNDPYRYLEDDLGVRNITKNGSYSAINDSVNGWDRVNVNVQPDLIDKYVIENGTYDAEDDNVDGYSSVEIYVPLGPNDYRLKSVANLPQAIASFSDGEEMVMPSLKVAIEPQQEGSGDPSPTNIRPISGWSSVNVVRAGKNLAENVLVGGSIGGTGVIGTASGYSMAYGKVKKGVTYTITTNDSQLVGGFFENEPQIGTQSYDDSRIVQASKTFTAPINGYIAFRILEGYTQYQLEIGLTSTTYEPYNGHTYIIDLDGTRYGGEVDVVNGVLTVDRAYVDLGTLSWISGQNANPNQYTMISTGISLNCKRPTEDSELANILCETYKTITRVQTYTSNEGIAINTLGYLYVYDANYNTSSSMDDFKASVEGVKLVYELATPITYQLTPTAVKSLLGQNNIWADTGNVLEGEYFSRSESVKLPLPSEIVDDQATHITIPNFSSYDKLKIDYKNINTQLQTVTISISSLPENNNPDWGQGGDIYIFNSWYYLVMSRDSTGVWLKECGNPLQQLTAIRI